MRDNPHNLPDLTGIATHHARTIRGVGFSRNKPMRTGGLLGMGLALTGKAGGFQPSPDNPEKAWKLFADNPKKLLAFVF